MSHKTSTALGVRVHAIEQHPYLPRRSCTWRTAAFSGAAHDGCGSSPPACLKKPPGDIGMQGRESTLMDPRVLTASLARVRGLFRTETPAAAYASARARA